MISKPLFAAALTLSLAACVTKPTTQSGFISDYMRLSDATQEGAATQRQFVDAAALAGVSRVAIAPTQLRLGADTAFTPAEIAPIAAEIDRQLCLELAERFEIAPEDDAAALQVSAAITGVARTGAASSVVSAAASRFIPGPGSVRLPIGLGGLAAEMQARNGADGPVIGELAWSRRAQMAMDRGSLSPTGDAHQAAEPFADAVAKLLTPNPAPPARKVSDQCPKAPDGGAGRFIAGRAMGLYVQPSAPAAEPKAP
jgi:hypothetical protein